MNCFHGSLLLFLLVIMNAHAENPDSSLSRITQNFPFIKSACYKFDVSPNTLSSIIFVERTLNVDWSDDALDIILAKTGHNSSIGFCQVKLKTAYWIEVQLKDSLSLYYSGAEYVNILPISDSPGELIIKLQDDSLNILYAAAYLRIIQSRWKKAGFLIDDRPEIIGTLYSTGLFYPDGTERIPRTEPEANEFGKKVAGSLKKYF